MVQASLLLAATVAAFVWWRFYFFHRNPPRKIAPGDALLSPADGRVLYCERVDLASSVAPYHARVRSAFEAHGSFDVTAIYLSIFDVHFVRAPVAGRLTLTHIAPLNVHNASMGTSMFYAALRRPLPVGQRGYADKNEFLGISIRGEGGPPLHLVLMADWWIDQIQCFVRDAAYVERGQVLAKIHMGSQVDLWTDHSQRQISCRVGDRVLAGVSSIGA